MQAKAAVAVAPRQVVFQAVETPEPGPDDVVVRVTHSWISNGTEGSFVRGERIGGDTPRSETDPLPFPHISGYQKVGIAEWVGANVRKVVKGDAVFATVSQVSGMFYSHAGHVSPAVTNQSQIWKLPEGLNPVATSGLVLTQVGYNCGIRPEIKPGDCAVVIGDGMVGHWAAQTLKLRGARVLLIGRHHERLRLFAAGPYDRLVNSKNEDPLTAIREWAPNRVHALVDTVGDIPAFEGLFPVMKHNSHLVSAGFYGHQGRIDIQKMRNQEMSLHTPAGWSAERMDATLELVRTGALQTIPLITHRFPASRAGEAFKLILDRTEPVLGVVLDWD